MERVLVDTAASPEVTFYADETPVDPDGQTATVSIYKSDGSTVTENAATTRISAGRFRHTRIVPDLDLFRYAWKATFSGAEQTVTTWLEAVGGYYFTLAELRAQPNLADTTKFPTAKLEAARTWFETIAERFCCVAFVPRYRRETLDGRGVVDLALPGGPVRSVRSVSVGGVAFTSGELAALTVDDGVLVRPSGYVFDQGRANVVVEYEIGHDAPPEDVHEAALVAARHKLVSDLKGSPARELSIANEAGGTTRLSIPSVDRPTGLLEVDAVLAAYRVAPVPGIA